MPSPGYKSVNLPVAFVRRLDSIVEHDDDWNSRDELVKAIVRDWLKTYRPPGPAS